MWSSLTPISFKMRTAQPFGPFKHILNHDNRFFVTALHGIKVNDVWYQQDGATCHTTHAAIDLLRQTFDGGLIS